MTRQRRKTQDRGGAIIDGAAESNLRCRGYSVWRGSQSTRRLGVIVHFLAPEEEASFLFQISLSKPQPLVRHVALVHVVATRAVSKLRSQPMRLQPVLESRLQHAVARDFAHVCGAVMPHRAGDAVFFYERLSGVVKLQGIVGRERKVQAAPEESVEGVVIVMHEEGVVAHGGHGYTNLR